MSGIEGLINACKWKHQWVMKDGGKIRIRDMTDNHLVNTVKFLLRRVEFLIVQNQNAYASGGYPQGEHAKDAFDREEAYWDEITPQRFLEDACVPFPAMLREIRRRKLDVEGLE